MKFGTSTITSLILMASSVRSFSSVLARSCEYTNEPCKISYLLDSDYQSIVPDKSNHAFSLSLCLTFCSYSLPIPSCTSENNFSSCCGLSSSRWWRKWHCCPNCVLPTSSSHGIVLVHCRCNNESVVGTASLTQVCVYSTIGFDPRRVRIIGNYGSGLS